MAKKKIQKPAKNYEVISGFRIPKKSEIYTQLQNDARETGLTFSQYKKKHAETIRELLKDYTDVHSSHVDKLTNEIQSLKKGEKVFINDVPVSRPAAIANVSYFQQKAVQSDLYPFIQIEVKNDLRGNIHLNLPTVDEMLEIEEGEDFIDYLDENYSDIIYNRDSRTQKERDEGMKVSQKTLNERKEKQKAAKRIIEGAKKLQAKKKKKK